MKNSFTKRQTLILGIISAVLAAVLGVVIAIAVADSAKVVFSDVSSAIAVSSAQTEIVSEPPVVVEPLVITSMTGNDISVSTSSFALTGTSDPTKALVMNGNEVPRLEGGEFSLDVELTPGKNEFVFDYNGEKISYIIRYNFTVIKAYSPAQKQVYEAGSAFVAVALARVDSSSVTATFNGQTITLEPQPYEDGDEFTNFSGTFALPTGNENDMNLGGVKFTGSCNGVTRSYTSPAIICLRDKALDKPQIVEILVDQAETFNGDTTDDYSRPTNSYLPAGTVDYKVGGIVYDSQSGKSYYNLRCGKRVYLEKKDPPNTNITTVSKLYEGELPEYNTVTLASRQSTDKHTVFTFDTAWRAPFSLDVGPQKYTNPTKRDYTISAVTYTYIDIKFFYSQTVSGDFAFVDDPLFSHAELIPYTDGTVLRLHLKSVGAFYGSNAEYNQQGQLEFKFLNPPTIVERDNLAGKTIVIDAGHGGKDIGASGLDPNVHHEAERNLALSLKLKAELEAYGATVIINRTTDVTISADSRCQFLREQSPDLCISIHHDSSTRASANGASLFCFNAFSNNATQMIFDRTAQTGLYKMIQKSWHNFYLARVTVCPVVLIENGFISNAGDFAGICDENTNIQKAKAITLGVLDYFNSFVQ